MKILALALSLVGLAGAVPTLAQDAGGATGRFVIRADATFYDTDILRQAYGREHYRTTILFDTKTGRTWVLMKIADDRVVWSSVDFAKPGAPTSEFGPIPGPAPSQ